MPRCSKCAEDRCNGPLDDSCMDYREPPRDHDRTFEEDNEAEE